VYIRFTVPSDPDRPPGEFNIPTGIIQAAWTLADDHRFTDWEQSVLSEETDWFNANVPAPGRVSRGRVVYWFRPEAREAISHAWALADLVEGIGVPVRVYLKHRPGTILYEDPFQVAAVPWKITFRR
jgi:hypothetical protein